MYMAGGAYNRIQHSNVPEQLRNALPVSNINPKIAVRSPSFHDLMIDTQFFYQCPTNRSASTDYQYPHRLPFVPQWSSVLKR